MDKRRQSLCFDLRIAALRGPLEVACSVAPGVDQETRGPVERSDEMPLRAQSIIDSIAGTRKACSHESQGRWQSLLFLRMVWEEAEGEGWVVRLTCKVWAYMISVAPPP